MCLPYKLYYNFFLLNKKTYFFLYKSSFIKYLFYYLIILYNYLLHSIALMKADIIQ